MPGRSWATEVLVRALQDLFEEASKQSNAWLRDQLDNIPMNRLALLKASFVARTVAGIPCSMVCPNTANHSTTVILYFHGGGYVVGSPDAYRPMLAELATGINALVLAPDYRLAPENPFPCPQDDCLTITRAVLRAYPEHTIVLMGDSAGGALAVSTALALNQDRTVRQPDALVLLSPWVEPTAVSGTMQSNRHNDFLRESFLNRSYSALMQGKDLHNPQVNFRSADLSAMPPTLIQCGEGEILYDQIQDFAKRAKKAGVCVTVQNYPAQFHVFQTLFYLLNDAKRAMAEVQRFVQSIKYHE
jgi:acetyl esterase/lipase